MILLAIVWIGGCRSAEERVQIHFERAEELFAEGHTKEGILELRSAAQIAPEDPDVSIRVAEASARYGYLGDAVDFYRDALFQRPDDLDTVLKLAELLARLEPDQVAPLIEKAIAIDRTDPRAYLLQSQLSLGAGDYTKALAAAQRARGAAPDDPEVYLGVARAHEGRLSQFTRFRHIREPKVDHLFRATLAAYDDYLERAGERPLIAHLAKARILSTWKGHEEEARIAFERLIGLAGKEGRLEDRLTALEGVTEYAKETRRAVLERWALRQTVEIAPDRLGAWHRLSELAKEGEPRSRVYREMLAAQPDNPAAHIMNAQRSAGNGNLELATYYLRQKLQEGMNPPVLLAAIADLQIAHKKFDLAALTIAELEERYPDDPITGLFVARMRFIERDYDGATATLEALVEENDSVRARMLLARTEHERGNLHEAIDAVNRAIRIASSTSKGDPIAREARRLKADILYGAEDYARALDALNVLERGFAPLTPIEQLRIGICRYETNAPALGRMYLTKLMESNPSMSDAALALARYEEGVPDFEKKIRFYLTRAYAAAPKNYELVEKLTSIDLDAGRKRIALTRLNKAIGADPKSPDLYLLRASALLEIGETNEAKEDAERAFLLSPRHRDRAIELLTVLYSQRPDLPRIVEKMLANDAASPIEADRLALIGRLLVLLGQEDRALEIFERALAEGSRLRLLHNDTAWLLAKRGEDLERAEALAKRATDAPVDDLQAVDTLGYVYLQSGQYEAARWQFQFAAEHASPPVALFQYHLGLALIGLDEPKAARKALETALRIDPHFSDADAARRELERLDEPQGEAKPAANVTPAPDMSG